MPNKACLASTINDCVSESGYSVSLVTSIQSYNEAFLQMLETSEHISAESASLMPVETEPPVVLQIQSKNRYFDDLLQPLISLHDPTLNDVLSNMNTIEPVEEFALYDPPPRENLYTMNYDEFQQKYIHLVESFDEYGHEVEIEQDQVEKSIELLAYTNYGLFQWIIRAVDVVYETTDISSPLGYTDVMGEYYGLLTPEDRTEQFTYYCHSAENRYKNCEIYCTDDYGGNWIGVQARERQTAAQMPFDRVLDEYADGFGSWDDGYWMGLDCLHDMTSTARHELLVELVDSAGNKAIAHYGTVVVDSREQDYAIHVGQ